MTDPEQLCTEISRLIDTSLSMNLGSSSDPWDLYEAYIFFLVIKAAKTEGASIYFQDIDGKTVSRLVFRTGPGQIYSKAQRYTHAVVAFPKLPLLEIHIGVMVSGKAGVLHECDVAVIDQAEAITSRSQKVAPRSMKVPIAIECKFYSSALSLGLGRSFMGLSTDLSSKDTIFVTNSSSNSLEKLLDHHQRTRRTWEHNVSPGQSNLIERFDGMIRKAFESYKKKL